MGMSVGAGGGDNEAMCDMNTTRLIDVMLVLLIMFIITITSPPCLDVVGAFGSLGPAPESFLRVPRVYPRTGLNGEARTQIAFPNQP